MAHFMIAHLQGGRYGAEHILKETTVQEMHRQQYTHFPNRPWLAGATYGFYERFQNNQRTIEHGGSMNGYTGLVFMMPQQHLGFFAAYNSNDVKDTVRESLIRLFLDRYYPVQKKLDLLPHLQLGAQWQQRSRQINGNYRFIRYPRQSIVKLGSVLLESRPVFHIETNNDGTLEISPRGDRMVEVEPLLFRYPGSNTYISFQQDSQGRINAMSFSDYVFETYEKLLWYEATSFQLWVAGFCVLTFLSACFVWPIKPTIRRWLRQPVQVSQATRLTQFLIGLIGVLNLFSLIGILLAVFQIDFWEFFFGMPCVVIALLYIPIITTGLTTGLPFITLLAWKDKHWSPVERLHCLWLTLAGWIFIVGLNYWNLLGFRF